MLQGKGAAGAKTLCKEEQDTFMPWGARCQCGAASSSGSVVGGGLRGERLPDHTELSRPKEDLGFMLRAMRSVHGF